MISQENNEFTIYLETYSKFEAKIGPGLEYYTIGTFLRSEAVFFPKILDLVILIGYLEVLHEKLLSSCLLLMLTVSVNVNKKKMLVGKTFVI